MSTMLKKNLRFKKSNPPCVKAMTRNRDLFISFIIRFSIQHKLNLISLVTYPQVGKWLSCGISPCIQLRSLTLQNTHWTRPSLPRYTKPLLARSHGSNTSRNTGQVSKVRLSKQIKNYSINCAIRCPQ